MLNKPEAQPKGLKAMFAKTKAVLFPSPKVDAAVRLEDAHERATTFMTELDKVLARSQAELENRGIRL